MVVDSDVDEFPACTLTAAIACAASGDAVAHAAETAELLNIEMDDLAWFLTLVAWMWLLQIEAREPAEAAALAKERTRVMERLVDTLRLCRVRYGNEAHHWRRSALSCGCHLSRFTLAAFYARQTQTTTAKL